jgi:hypothetical protein
MNLQTGSLFTAPFASMREEKRVDSHTGQR